MACWTSTDEEDMMFLYCCVYTQCLLEFDCFCVWILKLSDMVSKFWDILEKKNLPTYRHIGEIEGRKGETNIFLRVGPNKNIVCLTLANRPTEIIRTQKFLFRFFSQFFLSIPKTDSPFMMTGSIWNFQITVHVSVLGFDLKYRKVTIKWCFIVCIEM